MSIAKTVVNKPTTFLIIYALVVGLALYIVPQVPVDLFPEISPPILVIFTNYPGAGPEEVERTVTRPMEGALTNVSNVKKISSTSSESNSTIIMELSWGLDLSEATNEVRDKLEFVKDFMPEDAGSPQIFKFDPSLIPIFQLSVEGNRSPDELYAIAKDQIQPRLEQVDGVALVSLSGGRERAIRVEVSQNRLDAYGLTLTQVTQALAAQNIQIGSGSVYEGNFKYLVETRGQFDSIDDIRNAVITYKGGGMNPLTGAPLGSATPVRLRDFADVTDSFMDTVNSTYVNGKPGIYISMQKQSGTNAVEVADNIFVKLDEVREILPAGVSLTVIYDTTKIIRQSLNGVTSSAISGALLAMAILFLFLRTFKSTLIIGLSIPISILVTIMFMYFFGLTLNIMTLAGLTLGIGMMVDSSIVIIENIYRYREKGAKAGPAAFLGTREMITAITGSILTTVAIFLPLLLFKRELDIIGVLFQDLAFTIVISLLVSLVVAVSLVPVLSSKYLTLYTRRQRPIRLRTLAAVDRFMERGFTGLDNAYKRGIGMVLDHKGLTVVILVLIVAISFFTLEPLGGNVGFELAPQQAQDVVQINMEMPVGTRYEVTEDALLQMAEIARTELKGYQDIFVLAGNDGGFFGGNASNRGVLFVTLPPYEEQIDSFEDIQEKLRQYYDRFPAAEFNVSQQGFLGGSPIDIVLRTENLAKARAVAEEIRDLLDNSVDEVIEPEVSLSEGLPIASVVLDRDKAYSLGLNIYSVANEISASVDGKTAGRYRSGGEEIDILVILRAEDRSDIPDLESIYVTSQTGQRIPVSSIAKVERTAGPVSIGRENRSRVVHITAKQKPGVSLNAADKAVRKAITENLVLDEDVVLEYGGDFADLMKYILKFVLVMVVAMALVYGIMASLFESLLDPFIIFLTIFMIIPGILFLYSLMNLPFFGLGTPLSMFSAVGLLMLVGISVNNGIVLVDYTNLLRSRGRCIRDAVIEAGGNRLRPILMTSLTTILGIVPLAFSKGEGSELVRPIGQTILGGMVASTIMTLFLVPVLYAHWNRKHDINRKIISGECKDPDDTGVNGQKSIRYGGPELTEGGEA
jgi:HAE1 family hydrophobic/amphiphilic exporter-1